MKNENYEDLPPLINGKNAKINIRISSFSHKNKHTNMMNRTVLEIPREQILISIGTMNVKKKKAENNSMNSTTKSVNNTFRIHKEKKEVKKNLFNDYKIDKTKYNTHTQRDINHAEEWDSITPW